MEAAIEAGAEDVVSGENGHDIYCGPDDLHAVQKQLEESLGEPETSQLDWRPSMTVDVGDDQAEPLMNLLNALEDNDDVQRVAANYEMSDEVMARLGG